MRAQFQLRLPKAGRSLKLCYLFERLKERRGNVAQKTILLIDDEQGLIEALEDALVNEGYRVLRAFTGEEALGVLAREHVDLATVDIMLAPGPSLEPKTTSQ